MPRKRRFCPPGLPVHVIQRGNNRQACFADHSDLKAYAHWLREGSDKYGVDIHAWVFMTNHVHLLVTPTSGDSVSRCMQFLGRCYVRYFNHRHRRSGTLFEGRFKSSLVQSRSYLLHCQRYIELNPVRAGMVRDPADYTWSSYRAHAFGRTPRMWCPHAEYLGLGETEIERTSVYRRFFEEELSATAVADIRHAINTGLALGNERFKTELEALTGQPQTHRKRGSKTRIGAVPVCRS
jgi:putative transposase